MVEIWAVPGPAEDEESSANGRFKDRFRAFFWSSMIVATLVHFGAFAFWPELTADDFSFTSEELHFIELPPTIEVPPPPSRIARPATPVMATTPVDQEITIAPTTFETNPVETLPPPPEDSKEGELSAQPTFTPYTVAPSILNRDEIVRTMIREYPPLLREAGIGGEVLVYFFIDEEGVVRNTQINQSSGHAQLDSVALSIAGIYRFSPALNRDQRVPVWVSFPVRFEVIRLP